MTAEKYTYLLSHPQKLSEDDMAMLDSVIESYPYLQSARALQLKGLKKANSFLYNDALKVTAAYTTDRDILFDFITSESFMQHQISQAILKHDTSLNDLEVVSENVSEMLSIELDDRIKEELKKAEAILDPGLFERKLEAVSEILGTKIESIEIEEKSLPKQDLKEEVSDPSEVLEIDKPLEFTKKDTHSFSEWLQLTKSKPIDREEASKATAPQEKQIDNQQEEKDRKFELIEKFIQKKPKLAPKQISKDFKKDKIENTNLASPYTQAPEALMTETLAKVYLQQKNYNKAIQAYKILILKYPEKSGFFADQIRAIEKLINTEEK
ncbi:hypothetical protein [Ulvibacter antarcticus]|uniref:Tetratricopeptide repeat protein n=1 Tax=Ulvibacter antarcticus TaxID=442714 RepID=A0A3L9Z3F3_9FLAO|nr:hypothetical protein [Ulvibacter antarcticus]RMA66527.1 hypothetical protein BXY75_0953 [Ulvibacter antarcticus]